MEPTHVRLTIPDSIDPTELMGPADALLRRVEGAFDAMVAVRGNHISLTGEADEVELATSVFRPTTSTCSSTACGTARSAWTCSPTMCC